MMTEDDVRRPHKRVLLTPRDRAALWWMGEQYGARSDLLQVLLARLAGRPNPVDDSTVRTHIRRWEREGVATSYRFYRELWVTPTAKGLRDPESRKLRFRVWEPATARLAHVHAVGVTRLALEANEPSLVWESERELRQKQSAEFKKAQPYARVPDAAATIEGKRFGIEVETTVKAPSRYIDILRMYVGYWPRLIWYTPQALFDQLQPIVMGAYESEKQMAQEGAMPYVREVEVRPLPPVPGIDYGRLT